MCTAVPRRLPKDYRLQRKSRRYGRKFRGIGLQAAACSRFRRRTFRKSNKHKSTKGNNKPHKFNCRTNLIVDFGGGIKSEEDLKNVFEAGASAVSIGSIAVSDPDIVSLWADSFGAEKFIISADVRDNIVRTNGWTKNSGITLNQLISRYRNKNIRRVLCTDISRDGMLCGSNIELYKTIMEQFPDCKLIASGGISSLDDIKKLDEAKIPAVVIGKAIYEQQINLEELAQTFIQ